MTTKCPEGSGNSHGQSPRKVAAPGQRVKLERGNVKSKSQICLEFFRREGNNTEEKKGSQELSRETNCEAS